MKICHIVPWFPSAKPSTVESQQGVFEYRQVMNLNNRGHEFRVVSNRWEGQSSYEKINGFEVYRIPYLVSRMGYPVPNFIELTKRIRQIKNNWHPELMVYSHMEYLNALPSLYLSKEIPVVVATDFMVGISHFYGNKIIDAIGYLHAMLIGKNIFKAADGIQFIGSELVEHIPRLGIDRNKVIVIPRGVDTELFKPKKCNELLRDELKIMEDDIVVLYVGRLDYIKGMDYLLQSAKELIHYNKKVKFLIVGDGGLRGECNALQRINPENIIVLGFRNDVPELMNAADIFVLPSLAEGAANAVMEASASGLPVITTSVGEIPRIILDGETGILIEPRDSKGLVKALKRLVDNPAIRKRMGKQARSHVKKHYTWDIICERLEEFYFKVIREFNINVKQKKNRIRV